MYDMSNTTQVIGNVGREPELRETQSGSKVCDFSIAHNSEWTNDSGEKMKKTTWFKVTCWGKLAEIVAQYVKKGKQVVVEGTISASAWTDKDSGELRTSLDLKANTVKFLGSGNGSSESSSNDSEPEGEQKPPVETNDIPF